MKKRWKASLGIAGIASLVLSTFSPTLVMAEPEIAPAAFNADAATIGLPSTVPSLDNFEASGGSWTLTEGARIITSPDLAKRGQLLSTELTAFGGFPVPAYAGEVETTSRDVQLVKDENQTALGDEGFKLQIGETGLIVTAKTDAGVFYGTRAVSQLLRQESRGDQQLTLPAGSVTSVPKYKERGVILCACQINISPEWIERFLDDIADLRINQILLEMKLKSDTYPDTNTWSYYTPEEVAKFVAKAKEYNIDVIPEINSPGHMGIWLENSPQYQLVSRTGQYKATGLDISKPEARALYKKLIDEYDNAFDTKYWHMGADEYMIHDRYSNYPQLLEYARATFGPNAREDDAFIAFINEINDYVKGKGKTLRVFNDGINLNAERKVDTDVVIDYWLFQYASNIRTMVQRGYKLMNTTQALYWSRQNAYGVNTQALYNGTWNVGTFDSNQQIDKNYEGLLGARVSLWPDNSYMTENEVAMQTADSIAFLAQMTWSDSRPWPRWEGDNGMKAALNSIGKPYIRSKVADASIPNGTYGFPELDPVNPGPWQITKTYDDYYQIKNTQTNTCLTVDQTEGKHLSVITEVGAGATLATCKNMGVQYPQRANDEPQARVHQKWQIVPAGANKVTLRNAVTNQYLAIVDGTERHVDIQGVSAPEVRDNPTLLATSFSGAGKDLEVGSVAQFPRDVISTDGVLPDRAKFSLSREMGISVNPEAVSEVDPSTSQEVTVTVTAPNNRGVAASTVTISLSEGWRALPTEVAIPELAAGESATAKFKIQNVTSTEGTATFTWNTELEDPIAQVALSGVVGPRLCGAGFNNISASSEERRGEGPVNGRISAAFDVRQDGTANETTFWHTQWEGGLGSFPFWVVFNPSAALDGKNMTTLEYRPRVGKVNGRIKTYNIYLSETPLAGDADGWGDPVVSGQFENNAEWQKALMPENTKGQFVKLEITDVWDEFAGREDQFASAAAFCVASQVPPAELTAPEQPENPVIPAPSTGGTGEVAEKPINATFANGTAEFTLSAKVGKEIQPVAITLDVDTAKGYLFDLSAQLPAGLEITVNGTTATISGTPEAEFDGAVSYTLKQGSQSKSVTLNLDITVEEPPVDPVDPGDPGDPGNPGDDPKLQTPVAEIDRPEVYAGETVVITGKDFPADVEISGALHSDPVSIGTQTSDANGVVTFTTTIPADFPVGNHTAVLTQVGNSEVTAAVPFKVLARSINPVEDPVDNPVVEEPPAPALDNPAYSGEPSTSTPQASADSPVKSALAKTGAAVAITAVLALGLLAGGIFLTRRKNG